MAITFKLKSHKDMPIACTICTVLMFACFFALCVAFAKTDSLKLFVEWSRYHQLFCLTMLAAGDIFLIAMDISVALQLHK